MLKYPHTTDPSTSYFLIDCDYKSYIHSSYSELIFIVSYDHSQKKLSKVTSFYPFSKIFAKCRRKLLYNDTLLYRFCPLSLNPEGRESIETGHLANTDLSYSSIELYRLTNSDHSQKKLITSDTIGLERMAIDDIILYQLTIVIVDYRFGFYNVLVQDDGTFDQTLSYQTFANRNQLMDYKLEFLNMFPDYCLILVLNTDNYISEISITNNSSDTNSGYSTKILAGYNLNYNGTASNAILLKSYLVIMAHRLDTRETVEYLMKIYRRGQGDILHDLPCDIGTHLTSITNFYKDQDKFFTVSADTSSTTVVVHQVQRVLLEIIGTYAPSDYIELAALQLQINKRTKVTINVSMIPNSPFIYSQPDIWFYTSNSTFMYSLNQVCKGPAIAYGWSIPPQILAYQNATIITNWNIKTDAPIERSSHHLSDLNEFAALEFMWHEQGSYLSILWQNYKFSNLKLIQCHYREMTIGKMVLDHCSIDGSHSPNKTVKDAVFGRDSIYIIYQSHPLVVYVFSQDNLALVTSYDMSKIVPGCVDLHLEPSTNGFCFCSKADNSLQVIQLAGNDIQFIQNVVPYNNTSVLHFDSTLLSHGLMVYSDQTHVYVDKLELRETQDKASSFLAMPLCAQQIVPSTATKGFLMSVVVTQQDELLIITNLEENRIQEFSIKQPSHMKYLRDYPLMGFVLTDEQPDFKSGNDFIIVKAKSKELEMQYFLVFDPTKDSGNVFLYIDSIHYNYQSKIQNIWVPRNSFPIIVNLTKDGIEMSLLERNPYVYGQFNIDTVSNESDPAVSACFGISCVTFSYHLRSSSDYFKSSFGVTTELTLQDRAIYVRDFDRDQTVFDFKNESTQHTLMSNYFFSGPVGKYDLKCLDSDNDCPYTLRDFLTPNYGYTSYLTSRLDFGAPIKIRAYNDSLLVQLSEYRITFISLSGSVTEISHYNLRAFSLKCDEFVTSDTNSSLLLVCQRDRLTVDFLVFSLLEEDLYKEELSPKFMELPQGIQFAEITRMMIDDDIILLVGRQRINFDFSSLYIMRVGSDWDHLCLVQRVELDQYSLIGDIDIDYFSSAFFNLEEDQGNQVHTGVLIQEDNQVLMLLLNITRVGERYSTCPKTTENIVYQVSIWKFFELDVVETVAEFQQNDLYNTTGGLLNFTIGYASIEAFEVTKDTSMTFKVLLGTSAHTYFLTTKVALDREVSVSWINYVFRRYINCQNWFPEPPLLTFNDSYFFGFCIGDSEQGETNLLVYKLDENCQIYTRYNLTECMPVRMLDIGYRSNRLSISYYKTAADASVSDSWQSSTKHLLVTSSMCQFTDFSLYDELALVLKDEYFLARNLTDTRTQLGLVARNTEDNNNTEQRVTLTVYNYNAPQDDDDYLQILGLVLYGFIMGLIVVVIYGLSKVIKHLLEERKKGQDYYPFLGKHGMMLSKSNTGYIDYEF